MPIRYILLICFLPLAVQSTVAQETRTNPNQDNTRTPTRSAAVGDTRAQAFEAAREHDVVLDVPNLSVEQITLEVQELHARLSLDARVANLVQLTAGADVDISSVKLEIAGVQAELLLIVDLDNVAAIVTRTLETLDNNPEIIETLGQTLQQTVGTVGGVANQALAPGGAVSQTLGIVGNTLSDVTRPGGLLSQTVNSLGQTVYRTVSTAGNLVESTVDQAGNLVNTRNLGAVTGLTNVVRETAGQAGRTVRQVRDEAGNVLEYTIDQAGQVTNARVIRQAAGQNPGR